MCRLSFENCNNVVDCDAGLAVCNKRKSPVYTIIPSTGLSNLVKALR